MWDTKKTIPNTIHICLRKINELRFSFWAQRSAIWRIYQHMEAVCRNSCVSGSFISCKKKHHKHQGSAHVMGTEASCVQNGPLLLWLQNLCVIKVGTRDADSRLTLKCNKVFKNFSSRSIKNSLKKTSSAWWFSLTHSGMRAWMSWEVEVYIEPPLYLLSLLSNLHLFLKISNYYLGYLEPCHKILWFFHFYEHNYDFTLKKKEWIHVCNLCLKCLIETKEFYVAMKKMLSFENQWNLPKFTEILFLN